MTIGRVNPEHTLDDQGITGLGEVYYNYQEAALMEASLTRGEARLGKGGTLLVTTGKHTGRSPKDKFVVCRPSWTRRSGGTTTPGWSKPASTSCMPTCWPI